MSDTTKSETDLLKKEAPAIDDVRTQEDGLEPQPVGGQQPVKSIRIEISFE